jgi:hypothetical protein
VTFPSKNVKFGYTGDTKWVQESYAQYDGCQVLLLHLGSLISRSKKFKDYDDPKKCRELIAEEGHPYLFGLLHYLTELASDDKSSLPKLILLSEFGEELKGKIRIDLTERLSNTYESLKFLPVDIGLTLKLGATVEKEPQILCWGCNQFVKTDRIGYKQYGYGYDEALCYFCYTCVKSKPINILQQTMAKVCEYGMELRKASEFEKDLHPK